MPEPEDRTGAALVLVRHGQTDWNVEGRWQGQADAPLNARGREQAARAAVELRGFDFAALYSSDLSRARETAQIIGATLGLPVVLEPRLREINLGAWQGMLSADIQAQYPAEFERWHQAPLAARPPGGEDIHALARRVLEAINKIAARHVGQRVCIVAHELPIAIVLCRTRGLGLESLRAMIPENGRWEQVIWKGTPA
jgi:broad specificity phosphatase PhoE